VYDDVSCGCVCCALVTCVAGVLQMEVSLRAREAAVRDKMLELEARFKVCVCACACSLFVPATTAANVLLCARSG
jgi:hypothetical protein